LFTYKYVRIYGDRALGAGGTGNITITYQDTLEMMREMQRATKALGAEYEAEYGANPLR